MLRKLSRPTRRRVLTMGAWSLTIIIAAAASATAGSMITGKQIQNGSVTGIDIKNGSLGYGDLSNGARTQLVNRAAYKSLKMQKPGSANAAAPGANGAPGKNGRNGTDGTNGQDGAPGADGTNGVTGYYVTNRTKRFSSADGVKTYTHTCKNPGEYVIGGGVTTPPGTGIVSDKVQILESGPGELVMVNGLNHATEWRATVSVSEGSYAILISAICAKV